MFRERGVAGGHHGRPSLLPTFTGVQRSSTSDDEGLRGPNSRLPSRSRQYRPLRPLGSNHPESFAADVPVSPLTPQPRPESRLPKPSKVLRRKAPSIAQYAERHKSQSLPADNRVVRSPAPSSENSTTAHEAFAHGRIPSPSSPRPSVLTEPAMLEPQYPPELASLAIHTDPSTPSLAPSLPFSSPTSIQSSESLGLWSSRTTASTPISIHSLSPGISLPASKTGPRLRQLSPMSSSSYGRLTPISRPMTTPSESTSSIPPIPTPKKANTHPPLNPSSIRPTSIRGNYDVTNSDSFLLPRSPPPIPSISGATEPNSECKVGPRTGGAGRSKPNLKIQTTPPTEQRPSNPRAASKLPTPSSVSSQSRSSSRIEAEEAKLKPLPTPPTPDSASRFRRQTSSEHTSSANNSAESSPSKSSSRMSARRPSITSSLKADSSSKLASQGDTPKSRKLFGAFTKKPKESLPGPAAGTGHEGYGKYARGRRSSTSTSASRARSTSTNASKGSKGSETSQSSDMDDFLLSRLEPVIISGRGTSDSERRQSGQSRQSEGSSLASSRLSPNMPSRITRGCSSDSHVSKTASFIQSPESIVLGTDMSEKNTNACADAPLPRKSSEHSLGFLQPAMTDVPASRPSVDSARTHKSSASQSSIFGDLQRLKGKNSSGSKVNETGKTIKNFFQRGQKKNSAPIDQDSAASTERPAPIPQLPASRSVAHYAMLDSADNEPVGPELLNEIFCEVDQSPPESEIDPFSPEAPVTILPPPLDPSLKPLEERHPFLDTSFLGKPGSAEEGKKEKRSSWFRPVGQIPEVVLQKTDPPQNSSMPRDSSFVSFSRPFSAGEMTTPTTTLADDCASAAYSRQLTCGIPTNPSSSPFDLASNSPTPMNFFPTTDSSTPTTAIECLSYPVCPIQPEFLAFSQPEDSIGNGGTIPRLSSVTAVVPLPGDKLMEDEVWDEYDDLIDSVLTESEPATKTEEGGVFSEPCETAESTTSVGADAECSFSPLQSQEHETAPATGSDASSHLSPDTDRKERYRNSLLLAKAERQRVGIEGETNIRSSSLMTSRWLSFGRVLFSPAHSHLQSSQDDGRALVIDGLGNDDWSFYCALNYPKATVYSLSMSAPSTSPIPGTIPPPENHRTIQYTDFKNPFPFPKGFFTAVTFRFPVACSDVALRNVIGECKRVLRPGGYLELSVLDLDMVNMGSRTRRAVRQLKERIYMTDPNVSLRPMSDNIQKIIGRQGFGSLNRCMVGIPVAGSITASSDTSSSSGASVSASVSGSASGTFAPSATASTTTQPPTSPKPNTRTYSASSAPTPLTGLDYTYTQTPTLSLGALLSDPTPSPANDDSIAKLVAKVGRWWYTSCFETGVLRDGNLDGSIWADQRLMRECMRRRTGFRLLVAFAQKEGVAVNRRTASV